MPKPEEETSKTLWLEDGKAGPLSRSLTESSMFVTPPSFLGDQGSHKLLCELPTTDTILACSQEQKTGHSRSTSGASTPEPSQREVITAQTTKRNVSSTFKMLPHAAFPSTPCSARGHWARTLSGQPTVRQLVGIWKLHSTPPPIPSFSTVNLYHPFFLTNTQAG